MNYKMKLKNLKERSSELNSILVTIPNEHETTSQMIHRIGKIQRNPEEILKSDLNDHTKEELEKAIEELEDDIRLVETRTTMTTNN